MDFSKDKYIILEIIPTSLKDGDIVELTALKLDGIKLVDRFNYRLNKDKVKIKEFLEMCNYDDDLFNYVDTTDEILEEFKKFIGDNKLIVLDNTYTLNYLADFLNEKELIFSYFDLEFNDKVIEELVKKYSLEPSNYMVDLVYEAIIRQF